SAEAARRAGSERHPRLLGCEAYQVGRAAFAVRPIDGSGSTAHDVAARADRIRAVQWGLGLAHRAARIDDHRVVRERSIAVAAAGLGPEQQHHLTLAVAGRLETYQACALAELRRQPYAG